MKNKISKSILLGLGALSGLSLMVGNVFASYIVSSAPTLGVRITIAPIGQHTITYYLPTAESSTEYTKYTVDVDDGANLYDSLSTYVTDKNGFTFSTWHLNKGESYFRTDGANYAANLVANSAAVDEDITVYAKYVQNNVGYYSDGSDHYVTSSQTDYTVGAKTFYYGTRIYSVAGVEGTSVDLVTDSGVYNLTKNANNWNVSRVVNIKLGSWWNEWGPHTHIYLYNNTQNEWIDDIDTSDLTTKKNISVDIKYTGMILIRSSNNYGAFENLYGEGKGQTKDIEFNGTISGTKKYSSTSTCVYIWENENVDNGKIKCSWDA